MATMTKYDEFFDTLGNKAKSTISGYKSAILSFMQFVFDADVVNKENIVEYTEKYFSTEQDHFTNVKKFIQTDLKNNAPLGALQVFNQIMVFFETLDLGFTVKQRKQLKNQLPDGGKGDVVTEETVLDHKMIAAILKHLGTMEKSAVLCMATGGMRIGELLRIRCVDVDLTTTPARLYIRARIKNGKEVTTTKTKKGRYTFVTPETVDALREWIKVRGAYLESASKKGKNFKTKTAAVSIDDNRLFPCSDQTISEALAEAVFKVTGENAKCENTGRNLIHNHGFRKFFVSQLSFATSLDFADYLAGHVNTITKTYNKHGPEQLGEKYLTGMHKLYIEVPEEIRDRVTSQAKHEAKINAKMEKVDKELETVSEIRNQTTDATNKLTLYMAENAELKLRMEQMEEENNKKIAALQEDVAGLVEFMRKAIDAESKDDVIQAHGKMGADRILKQKPGLRE